MSALVIFDCDGVLIDSEHIASRTEAAELQRLGFALDASEITRRFVGVSARRMFAEIEREFGRPLPADFGRRIRELTLTAFERELRATPGIHDALARLGPPSCVASSSEPERVRRCLQQVGLWEHFGGRSFSASMVERGKPAPDLFLYAARRMDARADRCVVIEDSVPGVAAARAAGMRALGFIGGSHCTPDLANRLRAEGAEVIFDDMRGLPDLVDTDP